MRRRHYDKIHYIKAFLSSVYCLVAVLVFASERDEASVCISNASGITSAVYDTQDVGRRFSVEATLLRLYETHVFFKDASGAAVASIKSPMEPNPRPVPGDTVRIAGHIGLGNETGRVYAHCESIMRLGAGAAPIPKSVTATDFRSGKCDFEFVRLQGVVIDIIADPTDANFTYVVLRDSTGYVFVPMRRDGPNFTKQDIAIGSHLSVTGFCDPAPYTSKRYLGRICSPVTEVKAISGLSLDRFDVPRLQNLLRTQPESLAGMGQIKATGCVLAVWGGNRLMLQTEKDGLLVAELSDPAALPKCGENIEVAGLPNTDLYLAYLSRAVWRTVPGTKTAAVASDGETISIRSLFLDSQGRKRYLARANGSVVRFHGTVRSVTTVPDPAGFYVESEGFTIYVDTSNLPRVLDNLDIGFVLDITGVCVMETEKWNPTATLPGITGFRIVPRFAHDITVVSRPSMWTPLRLCIVLTVLGLVLIGTLFWTLSLHRLAEKRGRELAAATLAGFKSSLKIRERTRLAVELHDSLSQTLTGVSMEIGAANRTCDDREQMRRHLEAATKSLKTCREELKCCLWDLRNLTFDEENVEDAIRIALKPYVGAVSLSIRFRIPREFLSDNTAYAFLRIIRELTVNAIRHGRATSIRIAGSLEGNILRFSVRDNGCGFDTAKRPGMETGHFGLDGIQERVDELGGTFTIESRPAQGTKATVSIVIPKEILMEINA